ncbi:hypothetical protein ABW21_db0208492 [Orbilia brochopaga]|nr:hypothetical protein ABW21_db0208492 [Drechslerella brochopaga]
MATARINMDSRKENGVEAKIAKASNRNVPLAIWRLLRYHTFESLLFVYPTVYGACYSLMTDKDSARPYSEFWKIILGHFISSILSHGSSCTFNDIADRKFDAQVERTKNRPLPSGMITVGEAYVAYLIEFAITIYATYATLGPDAALTWGPLWLLFVVYPFMKRVVQWPQDARDDTKAGVKSLAVLLIRHGVIYEVLGSLGVIHFLLIAFAAKAANMSTVFWIFGVGVWGLSVPVELKMLDLKKPKSGGKVFFLNICLNVWVMSIAILEVYLSGSLY